MSVVVLVGNPRLPSRTSIVADWLALELGAEQPQRIELAGFGARVFDRDDADVAVALQQVATTDLLVVASPTYKGTFTGLLKVFLDQLPSASGISGVAVPLMLAAAQHHLGAADTHLRPVLLELGAIVPVPGLGVLDARYDDRTTRTAWLETAAPIIQNLVGAAALATPRIDDQSTPGLTTTPIARGVTA